MLTSILLMCVSPRRLTSFPSVLVEKLKYLHLTTVFLPQTVVQAAGGPGRIHTENQFGYLLSFSEGCWNLQQNLDFGG